MNPRKTLLLVLQGSHSVRFADFARMVKAFGFRLARVKGSHHLFSRSGIPEAVNLQAYHGEAKPYQVRQFLKLVEKYGLKLEDHP